MNINEEDPCYAIFSLCNKLIKRCNANSYSTSSLLKNLHSKHKRQISEAIKSSSNKAVSDSSFLTPKQRKLKAMNPVSIENYRPVKQWKINDRNAIKIHKKL